MTILPSMKKFLLSSAILSSGYAIAETTFNEVLLKAMKELHQGGGYSVKKPASDLLKASIRVEKDKLVVDMTAKGPTYCSGATYLAFLKAVDNVNLKLATGVASRLRAVDENERWLGDGYGLWGRWNANGPGTAMVVKELDLGVNFLDDDFSEAKAGDFLKIFWTTAVGRKERGHSVVFTRVIPERATGRRVKQVCYWSSQGTVGIGEDCKERDELKNMIFSRITKPWNINKVKSLPAKNDYLASLLKTESSFEEAVKMTGTLKKFKRK